MPRTKYLSAFSIVFLLGALTPYLAQTAEEKPRELPALKTAYIDMGRLFNECKSYKFAIEQMKTETTALEEKFKGEYNEMKVLDEALKKIPEFSDEHKTKKSELGKLELDFKFRQAKAREDFEARINKVQYQLFERIEIISHRVCDQYDIGLLLRHNTSRINPRDPKDVLRAINSDIVVADPRLDLTSEVLAELNKNLTMDTPAIDQ